MVHDIIDITTPFLFAALGGLFTQAAGVLNIGLEGLMLMGAFCSALGALIFGTTVGGALFGMAASLVLALVFAVVTLELRANIYVTGLAVNLLAAGTTALIAASIYGSTGVISLPNATIPRSITIPLIDGIPVVGTVLSGHSAFTYLAWLVTAATWYVLSRTALGRGVRAAGSSPETLYVNGLDPRRFRYPAILLSGALSGLAGASISLGLGTYVRNISAGRGWIALVAVFLGYKHPVGIAVACFVFAAAEYLSGTVQGSLGIPPTVTLSIPYLLTLLGLILVAAGGSRKRRGRIEG